MSKKFTSTLPDSLAEEFREFCKLNGYKFSEGIREGIRRLMKPIAVSSVQPGRSSEPRFWEFTEETVETMVKTVTKKTKKRLSVIPGTPKWKHQEIMKKKFELVLTKKDLAREIKDGVKLNKVNLKDMAPSKKMKEERLKVVYNEIN